MTESCEPKGHSSHWFRCSFDLNRRSSATVRGKPRELADNGNNRTLIALTGGVFVQAGAVEEQKLHAIHVRTGEHALAARIERWLTANQVATRQAKDAFDACVVLAEKSQAAPEIVIVGLDWLADDELGLLNLVRETWHNCVLIAYSDDRSRLPVLRDPLALVCCDPAQLTALLAGTTAAFLKRMRDSAARTLANPRAHAAPRHLPASLAAPSEMPRVRDLPIARETTNHQQPGPPDNFDGADKELQISAGSAPESPAIPSDLVSREELAALLNTYFR